MATFRDHLAARFSSINSRANRWLVVAAVVLVGLAAGGACGLCGLLLLANAVPGLGRPPAQATPQPAAVASPAPTHRPTPASDTAPQPAAAPTGAYHTVGEEWPGPPGEPRAVSLPPAETDPKKLEEAQSLYERGKAAFDAQEWEEAVARFDEALALDPRHAEAYNFRGAAYRHIGDSYNDLRTYLEYYDLSIADFTRSIAADPSWWRAYNNRGVSYYARANLEPLRDDRRTWYELARQDYQQASQLDPTQAQPWRNLATVHLNFGECDQAIEDLQKSQPWTTVTVRVVAEAYRCKGSLSDAMNLIEEAIAADPTDPLQYLQRSSIYFSAGEYAQALADLDTVAREWKGQFVPGSVWYNKAAAEYHLGQHDKVEEYILTGRRYTWIDWGTPYYYLGMVYLSQGRTEEAILALEWAEQTMDEHDPLLAATRAELEKLCNE